jgi:hypothetical protein
LLFVGVCRSVLVEFSLEIFFLSNPVLSGPMRELISHALSLLLLPREKKEGMGFNNFFS